MKKKEVYTTLIKIALFKQTNLKLLLKCPKFFYFIFLRFFQDFTSFQ